MLPTIPRLMRITGKVPPPMQAVEAVLFILQESPNGASTREIYQRATPKTIPRNAVEAASEHPFRSMRYLKKTVLATLEEKGVIEKFHVRKDPSEVEQAEAAAAASGSKGKKKSGNVPKLAWFWRVHEWERSLSQAKAAHEARTESKAMKGTNWPPSKPSSVSSSATA